jgi:hypothetical protein
MTLEKEVKVFRSVDVIGRDSINSIANNSFFTYEWFKTLETQNSFRTSPIYLTVYDEGKLVAFAPCFLDPLDTYFHYSPQARHVSPFLKKMVNFGRKLGFCQKNMLICYSPFSYRSEILIGKNFEKKHILSLLAEKIDTVCKKERALFSSFLFVSEFDELLIDNLQNFGYLKSPGVTNFYLDVRWSNFENYLESFNCERRKKIRREIRKCAENGVTIEEPDFKDLPAYFSELTSNIALKYNKTARPSYYSSLFSKLNEHAKDKIKVFVAKKENDVVGFSLFLRQGDILNACSTGFEYDALAKTDFTYYNLCYYAPIRWAIENGVKTIHYMNVGRKVRLYRGCEPENMCSFLKCHDDLLGSIINNALKPLYSYWSQPF